MPFDPSKIKAFPKAPGVYLMKDRKGVVLYVGKAKNLRSRVRQYFGSSGDGRAMIPYLTARVETVDTIVVESEKEALLLENTLIKKHQPKYNACFKDDKSYVSLQITKHKWPMIKLVRFKGEPKKDGHYFGPYTSAYAAKRTLDLLNRLFPLRQCSDRELVSRKRPCLLHQIGKCSAPCVGLVSEEGYTDHVNRAIRFLQGRDKEVLKELQEAMKEASGQLEFERAGSILKTIRAIEETVEHQKVVKASGKDFDVIGIYRHDPEVLLIQLFFRSGKLVGSHHHRFNSIAEDDPHLIRSFLLQTYQQIENPPYEILLPVVLEDSAPLEELLSAEKSHKVHLHTPQRGEKLALVKMAQKNALALFDKEKDETALLERSLNEMRERFRLRNHPRRIECFDTSNIAGAEPVASMVVFIDGKKESSQYRKYKIKTTIVPDDYAAMDEVLTRRFVRGKTENNLPDLIIVDGGKGQLNIASRVLRELEIVSVDVIALVKEEARHDKGMTGERVFIADCQEAIALPKTSPLLFLLQNIRDEAHRVAITFHRKRREKGLISSDVDTIPGIGPVKRKLLLKHFGSAKKLKVATVDQLNELSGLSQANIKAIQAWQCQ